MPDLSAHRRQHHAGGFPMKNGSQLTQCPKWFREHPEEQRTLLGIMPSHDGGESDEGGRAA